MKKQVSQVPAEDTYDTRYDDAQQAAEAAASRTPGPATWGFFAYNQVVKGNLSMDAGMASLNVALRRFSQFRWWGQFKDLAKGDGKFEREIRAWARERSGEDEADSSPIRAREMAEFKEALTQYGF
ncbi:MAG: hypothetical protein IPQ09_07190 [Myxococcales bacterium]|nr:hypothetical protein [Myxococcales bacterium]